MLEIEYIKKHIYTWKRLENNINTIKTIGLKNFSSSKLNEFYEDYNITCSHLSYINTYYKNSNTALYLNDIVSSAHSFIYSTKSSRINNIFKFYILDFPKLLIKHKIFFILSSLIFLLSFIASYILTIQSKLNIIAFIPGSYLSHNFQDNATKHDINNFLFSSSILTNNITVGILSFSLGLTFGIGTIYVLITNAFVLGSFAGLAYHQNFNLNFWALILPHGIIELLSIFICGAAGLLIGYSMINPGKLKRKDSILINGKIAINLILGTIPFYIIAGFIEGYITPNPNLSPEFKILFSIFTLFIMLLYIAIPNIVKIKRK